MTRVKIAGLTAWPLFFRRAAVYSRYRGCGVTFFTTMKRVVGVYNGIGSTAEETIRLAHGFAGKKLLVDFDPMRVLTRMVLGSCAIDAELADEREPTVAGVLDKLIRDGPSAIPTHVMPTDSRDLWLLPGSSRMDGYEGLMASGMCDVEHTNWTPWVFLALFREMMREHKFDVIVCEFGAGWTYVAKSAMIAMTHVVIPHAPGVVVWGRVVERICRRLVDLDKAVSGLKQLRGTTSMQAYEYTRAKPIVVGYAQPRGPDEIAQRAFGELWNRGMASGPGRDEAGNEWYIGMSYLDEPLWKSKKTVAERVMEYDESAYQAEVAELCAVNPRLFEDFMSSGLDMRRLVHRAVTVQRATLAKAMPTLAPAPV